MAKKTADSELFDKSSDRGYVVVARRFRPQSFDDLVGQDQVVTALSNAISRERVGHAYLFTGARGVGKTSTARIFAKCLNCQQGPSAHPCDECEICRSIATGEDVDVIEIDGASNRGIEEIRQLRANVNVRPSRARYKIYIIDEVHMLTMQAFNALLKTLEEPPAHVKFFFCTTDPEKIPITVLSRCQRFDLPPISIEQIKQRLKFIADQDDVQVDEEALNILARRANGSMRDSQSLLDQLFSFSGNRITADDVHKLLGTADSRQVLEILTSMLGRDTSQSLQRVAAAIESGVDAGQLTEQMLNLFRDMLALRVGCGGDQLLFCHSADVSHLQNLADAHGVEQILACIEIIDSALIRMRQSTYSRTLLETACVRICSLADLQSVADLAEQIRTGNAAVAVAARPAAPAPAKSQAAAKSQAPAKSKAAATKKKEPLSNVPKPAAGGAASNLAETPLLELTADNCEHVWKSVLAKLGDMTADVAGSYESISLESGRLVVTMKDDYHRDTCQRPERRQRLESLLAEMTGQKIRIDFDAVQTAKPRSQTRPAPASRIQKIRQIERHPFVQQAVELFDGEITEVLEKDSLPPSSDDQ